MEAEMKTAIITDPDSGSALVISARLYGYSSLDETAFNKEAFSE